MPLLTHLHQVLNGAFVRDVVFSKEGEGGPRSLPEGFAAPLCIGEPVKRACILVHVHQGAREVSRIVDRGK